MGDLGRAAEPRLATPGPARDVPGGGDFGSGGYQEAGVVDMTDPVLIGVGLMLFGVALVVLLFEELTNRRGR